MDHREQPLQSRLAHWPIRERKENLPPGWCVPICIGWPPQSQHSRYLHVSQVQFASVCPQMTSRVYDVVQPQLCASYHVKPHVADETLPCSPSFAIQPQTIAEVAIAVFAAGFAAVVLVVVRVPVLPGLAYCMAPRPFVRLRPVADALVPRRQLDVGSLSLPPTHCPHSGDWICQYPIVPVRSRRAPGSLVRHGRLSHILGLVLVHRLVRDHKVQRNDNLCRTRDLRHGRRRGRLRCTCQQHSGVPRSRYRTQ